MPKIGNVPTALAVIAVASSGSWTAADPEPPYGIGNWPEPGRGNHRAVVRVDEAAPAVLADIPWRRRDRAPEAKAVHVYDAATGQRVMNVIPCSITREAGLVAFQPQTVPGEYEIYYLPYIPGVGNFDDPGTYFAPEDTAEPAWREQCGLTVDDIAAERYLGLPRAVPFRIEARTEFDRMDPMEVIATPGEIEGLLAAHADSPYLLFPEDRVRPIRMPDDLPKRWVDLGPQSAFAGTARPGEFYWFQIGVCATREDIADLTLTYAPLRGDGLTVQPESFRCINLGGVDWLGRPFTKAFAVPKGMVRALWIGVDLPADAPEGTYTGAVTVAPERLEPTTVTLELTVTGPQVANNGFDELWRMSRLAWLDSTIGLSDDVLPPYEPVQTQGNAVRILDREIAFGETGLPEQITSRGNALLAAPMTLVAQAGERPLEWREARTAPTGAAPGYAARVTTATAGPLELSLSSRTEFDGCVLMEAALTATEDTDLTDIRLEAPIRREVATYLMGMSRRGGERPTEWHWKWDITRGDNSVWIGDVDAGLQLKLRGDTDVWDLVGLQTMGLPDSWHNGGLGGCDIVEEGDAVVIRAYSGARTMRAGQTLMFRFRLLVTPFRRIDPNHWNWRYGDLANGGNIVHVHHATSQNPYINYPFIEVDALRSLVSDVKSGRSFRGSGRVSYPAEGHIDPQRGSLHLWVRPLFATDCGENQTLFYLDYPNEDSVGFYWNRDDVGMRAYLRKGAPGREDYPVLFGSHMPEWPEGESRLLTLSWGERLEIYADGALLAASGPWPGLLDTPLEGAQIRLTGGFAVDAIKITSEPYVEGAVVEPVADGATLLLDTFTDGLGVVSGQVQFAEGRFGREVTFRGIPQECGVNVYYTVRELSNYVAEMWALRSLGDEVLTSGQAFIYSVEEVRIAESGGGYPWLMEHLITGYVPAWRQPIPGGMDASIATQGLSRWHNYYLEGLAWLMEHTGVDGLYLDGIGYDRDIMKRVAMVMHVTNPDSRVNFHSGNNYDFMDRRTSPMNEYMEHLPYMSNLWFGELYDYDRGPDYWMVEISGLPFGLTSEMLNYENGGNPYRGMVYGMSGRQHPSAPAMWRVWDEFGIQDAQMLGYWDDDCPVRTDRADVLATAYVKPDEALIALAHWPSEAEATGPVEVRLRIDWEALGLSPDGAVLVADPIERFQGPATFAPGDAISIESGKGWLLRLTADGA